jgi:o-succinylbenzoate---CoA ligase
MNGQFDLEYSRTRFPHHVALITSSGVLTYNDVRVAADAFAGHLLAHDVSHETCWLAIEPRADLPSVVMVLTLVSLGLPFVALHPSWSDVEKAAVLQQTGATLVPIPSMPALTSSPALTSQPNAGCYARLERATSPEDPLCVVYTSGTTAKPKGVILSRRAFTASANEARSWLQLDVHDRWYLSLPLAHVGGLSVLTRTWLTHSAVALPSNTGSFDAARFMSDCAQNQATFVSLVPTQLHRICMARVPAPATLRCVLLGGAPASPSLITAASELGFRVLRTYGLTEFCSMVATETLRSVSQPDTGAATTGATSEHGLSDPTDALLSLHHDVEARVTPGGRLQLRGQTSYSGYWGHARTSAQDWFTTEDVAELTNFGHVRILGRADDAIVTGGEKVHPARVESALLSCPGIEQACVFGRTSREWGQEVCAALVTADGFRLDAAVSHLRACLPSYNIPRAWALVSRLPITPNGKVQRSTVARDIGPLCQYI